MELNPTERPLRTCLRCGKSWRPRQNQPPTKCPRCQSPYWNQPKPSPLELLGPGPHKMADLLDKQMVIVTRNLPELRSLDVDILDATDHLLQGLTASIDQVQRARNHAATSLSILEALMEAASPRYLPPAAAEGSTQGKPPEIPQEAPSVAAKPKEPPPAPNAQVGSPALAPRLAQEIHQETPRPRRKRQPQPAPPPKKPRRKERKS